MSEESNTPTPEQVREARHAGFGDAIGYMDEARRDRIGQSYKTQDGRREANISGFVNQVTGAGEGE